MEEIEGHNFTLNISRYISTAVAEEEIDLGAVNAEQVSLEQKIEAATERHNAFLKELRLPLLRNGEADLYTRLDNSRQMARCSFVYLARIQLLRSRLRTSPYPARRKNIYLWAGVILGL